MTTMMAHTTPTTTDTSTMHHSGHAVCDWLLSVTDGCDVTWLLPWVTEDVGNADVALALVAAVPIAIQQTRNPSALCLKQ